MIPYMMMQCCVFTQYIILISYNVENTNQMLWNGRKTCVIYDFISQFTIDIIMGITILHEYNKGNGIIV